MLQSTMEKLDLAALVGFQRGFLSTSAIPFLAPQAELKKDTWPDILPYFLCTLRKVVIPFNRDNYELFIRQLS